MLALLAAATPAPGGGTAAALAGATAAALSEMAATFALRRSAGEDTVLAALRDRAAALRGQLLGLADADLASYQPVLDARSLPREDHRRGSAVREALSAATATPLEIAAGSAAVAELASTIARAPANDALSGDAHAAIVIAAAATSAAAKLVQLNLERTPEDPRVASAVALAHRAAELRDLALGGHGRDGRLAAI